MNESDRLANIQDKLESLRLRYLKQLQEQSEQLRDFRVLAVNQQMQNEDYEALKHLAHKLTGSGATYGYPQISEDARAIESLLTQNNVPDSIRLANLIEVLLNSCSSAVNNNSLMPDLSALPENKIISSSAKLPLILIADDDPVICQLIYALLSDEAELITAKDGEEVFQLLESYQPQLIILDDEMPNMTGIQVLMQLKSSAKFSAIPVIMLTANNQLQTVMTGILEGAVDYLIKPFDAVKFTQTIKSRLTKLTKTILIADDDPATRELLSYKFQLAGYGVLTAMNGVHALALACEYKPDLIILDVMMPGLDGVAVLQKLHQEPALQNIPVLFLTAKRRESDILEGFNLGVADYITKPFIPDEVIARCVRLIKE